MAANGIAGGTVGGDDSGAVGEGTNDDGASDCGGIAGTCICDGAGGAAVIMPSSDESA
jgi:hypothetical protein